jgi:DNA ligase (NAD+)
MNAITKLVETLMKAKESYYNDEPIMDDETFDQLEEDLRKADPNNAYFNIVGIPTNYGEKIKHQIPMLSCAKAKSIDEVREWLNKILDKRVEIIVEPKVDAGSGTIVYDKGKLQYISTRGDGEYGRIITHLKDYLNIPKTISPTGRVEVRGEIYLPQNTAFPNPENKPLRNLANGLINRKDTGLEDLKYLKFVAYQLYGTDLQFEDKKIDLLQKLGFDTVSYKLFWTIKELEEYFEEYKSSLREKLPYQTDGLVLIVNDNSLHKEIDSKYVVEHHHHYNIALKPPSESRWTTITGITKQVSRSGNVIPVVEINPIIIGGSTISRVTANNYGNVEKLRLNVGDKIHVSKANDVIPFLIESVATKDKSDLIPIHCPSCGTELIWTTNNFGEHVHLQCTNLYCPERNIQLISYWVEKCEMDDFAESTIRTLYENKFIEDIIDLYTLKDKYQYLKGLAGFGDKKIDNMLSQIEKSKNMTVVQFLARLGIELVGEKAVKKLGIKTIDDFWKFNDGTYVIGQNLIAYRKANKKFIIDLLSIINMKNVVDKQIKGKICMTGEGHKGRKELIKELEDMGYEFVSSITKDTNILICDDINGSSTKLQKAKKLGIKIVSYEEFFK